MAANLTEDEFQEEVLRLFAFEALEWVRQLKAALLELEGDPAPDRARALYDVISRSLASLKGSAATVGLSSIENLAGTLVPLLQSMQGKKLVTSSGQYAALRRGLEALSSAVQMLAVAETTTGLKAEWENIGSRLAEALHTAMAEAQAQAPAAALHGTPEEGPAPAAQAASMIEALLALKRAPTSFSEPSRNIPEMVLRRIHSALDLDSARVIAASVRRIVQDLEILDERFLEQARQRSKTIAQALAGVKAGAVDSPDQKKSIEMALRETALLYEEARAVDAVTVVQFLHGLESLLMEILYKRVTLPPKRFEAVASRVETLLPMAQRCVEEGRAERAAIEDVLTRVMSNPVDRTQEPTPSLPLSR